jgi:streptogramin lyase
VCKLDLDTGALVARYPTPDGGGIHGIEWDDGLLWLTAFNPKALILVDPKDFSVVRKLPMTLDVLHGLARDGDGIWCADRKAHAVARFNVETGDETDRIEFPDGSPDPHGLSIKDGELWYCDAAIEGAEGGVRPEIRKIVR